MNKKLILILATGQIFASCHLFENEEIEAVYDDTKFVRREKIMVIEEEYCANSSWCSEVTVSFLEALKGGVFADRFNKEVQKKLLSNLKDINERLMETEELSASSSEETSLIDVEMKRFLGGYKSSFDEIKKEKEYTTENDVYLQPYVFNYKDSILYADANVLSLSSSYYVDTGGAHGYGHTSFLNFKPDGTLISNKEFIANEEELAKVVEKYFRISYDFPTDMPLSETGFFFEDGFVLPESIGFKKDSLLLYYNDYEIAPYSAGPTTLTIPMNEVKDYISLVKFYY